MRQCCRLRHKITPLLRFPLWYPQWTRKFPNQNGAKGSAYQAQLDCRLFDPKFEGPLTVSHNAMTFNRIDKLLLKVSVYECGCSLCFILQGSNIVPVPAQNRTEGSECAISPLWHSDVFGFESLI